MDAAKLKIIMQLMEELQEDMQEGEEDFSERLGRKKPEPAVSVSKLELGESEIPGEGIDDEEEDFEDSLMSAKTGIVESDEDEDISPEDSLKRRLLAIRK